MFSHLINYTEIKWTALRELNYIKLQKVAFFVCFFLEEGKMDQLFLEAEGNRRIASQTAQRAFLACQDILPTGQKVTSGFA